MAQDEHTIIFGNGSHVANDILMRRGMEETRRISSSHEKHPSYLISIINLLGYALAIKLQIQ